MKMPPGIRQLGPDHWEIRAQVKNPRTGEVHRPKRHVTGTLKEAVAARKCMVAEYKEGDRRTKASRETLTVSASSWIEHRMARGERASTRLEKVKVLEQHILPHFGQWYTRGIRRTDVEAWVTECCKAVSPRTGKPYRATTINSWLRMLKALVTYYYEVNELGPTPLAGIDRLPEPRRPASDPNCLPAHLLGPFLARLRECYPRQYAMMYLGFTTGLRWSEISALEWIDLDEGRSVLTVQRAQVHKVVEGTKTDSSRREIALVPEQLEVLRQHRLWLVKRQYPGLSKGLMFPSRVGGYSAVSRVSQALERVRIDLGIPYRVTSKAMRRTFDNLVRQAGADHVLRRAMMGHTTEDMDHTYCTADLQEQAAAVGKVVQLARSER